MTTVLLVGHVLLTTIGYAGLIVASCYVLLFLHSRDPQAIRIGLTAWRRASRIFGPCLLAGIALGFGTASEMRVPLGSPWLVAAYALVAVAIVVQASIMIPWQLRSNAILEAGVVPQAAPVIVVVSALCVLYTSILWLMLLRPG